MRLQLRTADRLWAERSRRISRRLDSHRQQTAVERLHRRLARPQLAGEALQTAAGHQFAVVEVLQVAKHCRLALAKAPPQVGVNLAREGRQVGDEVERQAGDGLRARILRRQLLVELQALQLVAKVAAAALVTAALVHLSLSLLLFSGGRQAHRPLQQAAVVGVLRIATDQLLHDDLLRVGELVQRQVDLGGQLVVGDLVDDVRLVGDEQREGLVEAATLQQNADVVEQQLRLLVRLIVPPAAAAVAVLADASAGVRLLVLAQNVHRCGVVARQVVGHGAANPGGALAGAQQEELVP